MLLQRAVQGRPDAAAATPKKIANTTICSISFLPWHQQSLQGTHDRKILSGSSAALSTTGRSAHIRQMPNAWHGPVEIILTSTIPTSRLIKEALRNQSKRLTSYSAHDLISPKLCNPYNKRGKYQRRYDHFDQALRNISARRRKPIELFIPGFYCDLIFVAK